MFEYIFLIILLPFIGMMINGLLGKKIKNENIIATIGSLAVGIPFIIACTLFYEIVTSENFQPTTQTLFTWIAAGNFSVNIAYQIDQLSILFTLIITGIGLLIHIYSAGYMHGDRSFYRFFAYLNLFIFMMLNLVLADNFLLTFLGWEGVGLASYLLIGFWYDRKFEGVNIIWTGDAGKKAFVANRIGDFGFLIAMFLIFANFESLQYNYLNEIIFAGEYQNTSLMFWITLCLFIGCCGKSAQLPLSVWLPDAMAGPTPVSALIHAATMVTAGIFLIARNSLMFALAPDTMTIVAIVGIITALWAATIGLVQNDFKKVLAYSTVSQLGFMFAALGVGAFTAGVFHVMTHAFFKGLLFLAAGAVIHGMHDLQDIKQMGNLRKYMPTTHKTFMIATLAIAGIPFFSGFFSKDEIMWNVYNQAGFIGWFILLLAAFCTAFYMFRLAYLVFYGEERFNIKSGKNESKEFEKGEINSNKDNLTLIKDNLTLNELKAGLTNENICHAELVSASPSDKEIPKQVRNDNAKCGHTEMNYIHPHEASKSILIPLVILAILSAFGGFLGVPYVLGAWFSEHPNLIEGWLAPIFAKANVVLQTPTAHEIHLIEYLFISIAIIIAVLGILLAGRLYKIYDANRTGKLRASYKISYKILLNKYFLDEGFYKLLIYPILNFSRDVLHSIMDVRIVDGFINWLAGFVDGLSGLIRRMQTGMTQTYAIIMVVGIVVIIGVLLL